jgi:hypothetical protein
MTKKEFQLRCDYHKYTGAGKENDISAIFYDRTSDGNKYCVYARTSNAGKKALIDELYKVISGEIEDTVWYIQLVVAETDEQRFKVPIMGSGLNYLIKRTVKPKLVKL